MMNRRSAGIRMEGTMTTTITRSERAPTTRGVLTNKKDTDQLIRTAIDRMTPTPSAPEWATAESLRNVGNGFGGPY
jgi:hypothetical protein